MKQTGQNTPVCIAYLVLNSRDLQYFPEFIVLRKGVREALTPKFCVAVCFVLESLFFFN